MKNFHIATLASAGTGKTYSLVENYIHALFGLDPSGIKKRPHQILALTFTQKAAHEMRIRIAKRLTAFLNTGFDESLHNEALEKGIALPHKDEIKLLLRALPNANIATFHAFAATVIRQEALSLDIVSDFEILSPDEELSLAKNSLRPLILRKLSTECPTLRSIVARFRLGAGLRAPGLIEGLINCYFGLSEQGISSLATNMQKTRFRLGPHDIKKKLTAISDIFRDFCSQKQSESTKERCKIIEEQLANFSGLIEAPEEEIVTAFLALREAVKGNFGDKILRNSLVESIVALGASLVDHFVAEDEEVFLDLLSEFHREFSAAKKSISKLSYADLLITLRDVLRDDLSLRARLKERFLHVMVDEYQDTSPIQEEIIALLAENKNSEISLANEADILSKIDLQHGASLFVVGDKKQSIYGFRGAETVLFDRMIKKMRSTHSNSDAFSKRVLKTNYRSDKKVIELVNKVSHHALSAQGYSSDDELLSKSSSLGHVELLIRSDDKDLSPTSSNLDTCAHAIRQLLHTRADLKASDITVLVRRIKSGGIIKAKLASFGIAARIIGGEGFYQQQEIIDCLSLLQLLIDPSHEIASLTVLRSPFVLLSDQDIISIGLRGRLDLLHAKMALRENGLSSHGTLSLEKFFSVFEEAKVIIAKDGCTSALDHLLNKLDFSYAIGLSKHSDQKFHNLKKLGYLLSEKGKIFSKTIAKFYRRISENYREPLAASLASDDAVSIMTIHQSKGLEFKGVIIADTESMLPNESDEFLFDKEIGCAIKPKGRMSALLVPKGADQEKALTRFLKITKKKGKREQEEMARLLYVALTRAQHELYVVSSFAGFESPKNRSLLALFLGALKNYPSLTRTFIHAEEYENISQEEKFVSEKGLLFCAKNGPLRYFSSALKTPLHLDFSHLIKKPRGHYFRALDGNLAHQILSEVGAQLVSIALDDGMLRHLIAASFRAQGIYDDAKKAQQSLEACFISLKALSSWLFSRHAIFEMPLFARVSEMVVIEGFSDLVIDFNDYIGIIEFKSSYKLATHPDSYLQIFAYAMALKKYNKPIKYALMLVGTKDIQWQDFTTECEEILLSSVGVQDHPEEALPAPSESAWQF